MNRRILRLAIPNMISNITIPLIGMVDTAIAGRLGDDGAIGAVAIGAAIFGMIYWNCAFLRMGASGLTAQAFGSRNFKECADILVRSVVVALGLAALLLIFQLPIGKFSIGIMQSDAGVKDMVAVYFFARIWGAPATISLYAIHGWFIGMQNAKVPMWISIISNFVHIIFSFWFVYGFDMGIAGIAYGTVVSQYFGALLSWFLWYRGYKRFLKYMSWRDAFLIKPLLRFFNVNKDIFMRTACNVLVYTFITYASSGFGNIMLATNSILIQLFTFYSYMSDGFAYAAEAITGRFTGARNFVGLRHAMRNMFWWSFGIALFFVFIYRIFWRPIIQIFTNSEAIITTAGDYILWIMLVPLVSFAPFLMDGILIGATRTKILRNSMAVATVIFFALFYSLVDTLGNNALWFSFVIFLISRGVAQYLMSGRMRILYEGVPTGTPN